MVEAARLRSGSQLDPWVVSGFLKDPNGLTDGFDQTRKWQTCLDAEPGEGCWIDGSDLLRIALAFAKFTGNKSCWFVGHSRQVAGMAYRAACAKRSDEGWRLRKQLISADMGHLCGWPFAAMADKLVRVSFCINLGTSLRLLGSAEPRGRIFVQFGPHPREHRDVLRPGQALDVFLPA